MLRQRMLDRPGALHHVLGRRIEGMEENPRRRKKLCQVAGAEVGIHGGVSGTVSGNDNVISEPAGETGGHHGVGGVGQVICVYPYVNCVPINCHRNIA